MACPRLTASLFFFPFLRLTIRLSYLSPLHIRHMVFDILQRKIRLCL